MIAEDRANRCSDFIAAKKSTTQGETQELWRLIEDFYSKKLWYQLTETLKNAITTNSTNFLAESGGMQAIYENLVSDLEQRINPFRVAEFARKTVSEISSVEESIAFLERVVKKIPDNFAAKLLLITCESEVLLKAKKMAECKEQLEKAQALIDETMEITEAHAHFYLVSSEYYRFEGTHSQYFREALKYLGVVNLETVSFEDRRIIAGRLAVAAIVSEDIFSFGELLVHPIIAALRTPHDQWLFNMINAINCGDTGTINELRGKWAKEVPELAQNEIVIHQKAKMMALIEMSYQRKPDNRVLSFEEISGKTGLPIDQIEFLLMKAMASGLVRGEINQVKENFKLDWVKPRVLSYSQVDGLANLIEMFEKDVAMLEKQLEETAGTELIAPA